MAGILQRFFKISFNFNRYICRGWCKALASGGLCQKKKLIPGEHAGHQLLKTNYNEILFLVFLTCACCIFLMMDDL